ncbi:lysophospholipase [bacterium]|nr:lysophospholipase [bacterium]MDC0276560.1 lysophospholipase [Verrucomicrobiales bacterium]
MFAHCFNCTKDIAAATHVSRNLAQAGFAVLRFDFTGLGNSDGDFGNTNFSANVQDLVSAARAVSEAIGKPVELLIGQSLGGAAAARCD